MSSRRLVVLKIENVLLVDRNQMVYNNCIEVWREHNKNFGDVI